MRSIQLIKRTYHDGCIDKHDEIAKCITFEYPVYTLFRHEIETEFGERSNYPTFYTIVADYGNHNYNNWVFDNIENAFRCFRMMVGVR